MTKQLKVDSVVNLAGTGKPNFPVSPTSGGAALSTLNTHSYTSSATEPSSPKNGAIWWDSANSKVYVYANGEFKEITLNTDYPSAYAATPAWSGDRALAAGGVSSQSTSYDDILYFNIAGSGGNSANFGDLVLFRYQGDAAGSSTRACFMGGYNGSQGSPRRDDIDYVTPSTTGNGTDFGNLTVGRSANSCCSNGTRALSVAGYGPSSYRDIVDYITIDTPGNAVDFGDLSAVGTGHGGSAGDATRAVVAGGIGASYSDTIEYFTYSTTGNATDFGDLLYAANRNAAVSDATRSVFMGAASSTYHTPANANMEYITTQTTGNGTDFGDLSGQYYGAAACENATKGVVIGDISSSPYTGMEVITIQTTSNGSDFGDLLENRGYEGMSTSGNPS